jgi:NTP pyrophosphatase (non-canonical NTP hydrolase)
MTLSEFQEQIRRIYGERDGARGALTSYAWLNEEVGELARAMRSANRDLMREEVSDVLAWLTSLATILGVDIEDAAGRFAEGCPKCGKAPCRCAFKTWLT